MNFGFVAKKNNVYYINCINSPPYYKGCYPVSPRSEDEHCIYGIEEVEAYLAEHPEMFIPESTILAWENEDKASLIRSQRNTLMAEAQNKVDRYHRQVSMGVTPTDNIHLLYQYQDDLANVPQQEGFPTNIIWPNMPEE